MEDKGVGFDVEEWRRKLEKIRAYQYRNQNVEEMIRIEYGDAYGIWIESEPGKRYEGCISSSGDRGQAMIRTIIVDDEILSRIGLQSFLDGKEDIVVSVSL